MHILLLQRSLSRSLLRPLGSFENSKYIFLVEPNSDSFRLWAEMKGFGNIHFGWYVLIDFDSMLHVCCIQLRLELHCTQTNKNMKYTSIYVKQIYKIIGKVIVVTCNICNNKRNYMYIYMCSVNFLQNTHQEYDILV